MHRSFLRTGLSVLLCVILFFSLSGYASAQETSQPDLRVARPSEDGHLQVSGTSLSNQNGKPVILRGISTHGLTWYPDYVNSSLFLDVSRNWDANLVRLAMYSEDYLIQKEENLEILFRGIDAAIQADMYVLVDWHILNDYNPLMNMEEAEAFFELISSKYAGIPNVLYEICNEPNQDADWEDIYTYANQIIPVIRRNSPDAVIVVGTPEYDQDLVHPLAKPLDDPNTLYSFHFYTSSHHDEMMQKLDSAIQAGLPVFISECGITEADGNGKTDYEYAVKWFHYLHEHNISYVIWNLSNKLETSSFIKANSGATRLLTDQDLTDTGKWVRELLRGVDPADIPQGGIYQKYAWYDYILMQIRALGSNGLASVRNWWRIALGCGGAVLLFALVRFFSSLLSKRRCRTYDDVLRLYGSGKTTNSQRYKGKQILIYLLMFLSLMYLCWRILYSINTRSGPLPIICNILLLVVEVIGFIESSIHYANMIHMGKHPLPEIADEEYPEVDIFIATYNEPEELLRKTINGCTHLKYPDKQKVHIWVCDDNRRSSMRQLAQSMGVGYFDRPDNEGAKAGNLNHAMGLTHSPYVVTLDADMIVKSDFLLKTIPYFVQVEKLCADLPEEKKKHLGLLQTPQCFYDPDVFQYALYSEKNIPNEQDFFYRTIEAGKTSTNSVIYGGSNTVLSRRALEAIGGFFTESITEDFATGALIEAAGFLSLGLDEPLASGKTPNSFKDHIKQRTRWGRGVINTAKRIHLFTRKDLFLDQKLSYLSSVAYWYSPIKNLIYVLSPLFFAAFLIPVFRCNWLELLVFWFPMFLLQDLCLRVIGSNSISLKWSNIYELSVMPFLLSPIIKESFGISLARFQVTDKSKKPGANRKEDLPMMIPFLVLLGLSVFGIIRILCITNLQNAFGMLIILFWLFRNLYSIIMVLFLIDGRDSSEEEDSAKVQAGEFILLYRTEDGTVHSGITTQLTERGIRLFLDEPGQIKTGDLADLSLDADGYHANLHGIITGVKHLRYSEQCVCSFEILNYGEDENEYLQILYDRIPSLPQSLRRDFGYLMLLWRNIIYRAFRSL